MLYICPMKTIKTPKVSGLKYALAKKGASRGGALDMLRAPDESKLAQIRKKDGTAPERATGSTAKDFKSFENDRINVRKKTVLEWRMGPMGNQYLHYEPPTKLRPKEARQQERKDIKVVRRGTASNATPEEKFLAERAIEGNKELNTRRTFNNLVSYEHRLRRKYNNRMKGK